jgi:Na+-transporting methylmalonyl-CoA/oxaloacetate decarboxylase gamma subunit
MAAIFAKFSTRQWPYFILITPTTALLNADTTNQVTILGKQRLGDTLVGAVLVILAALITLGMSRLVGHKTTSPQPVSAPPASPAEAVPVSAAESPRSIVSRSTSSDRWI